MRKILTVFIASPSDLGAERKRTFEVVDEINKAIKKIDWSIDLLGWEDTLPGIGRPQALINRDVDRCDLFIGLLWRKWGTPPARDSAFSSGFEEEFSIARSRRERGSLPEIWMFFKTVESAQIADAGIQLKRVIAFRESLIKSKAILFKEFDSLDVWEKTLRTCLLRHVLATAGTQGGAPEGPSERTSRPTEGISTEADRSAARAAGQQLAVVARSLEPAFESGNLGEIAAALNDADEIAFLAVRTCLLSVGLVSASGTSATPVPTHELNTLYRYRDRLRATSNELYFLFKTLLSDNSDHEPGWYWFRELDVNEAAERLLAIALFDDNTQARARSFEILRRANVSIFTRVDDQVLKRSMREVPSDLHDDVWAYLVDVTTAEDLRVLQESAAGTWLELRIQWLQSWTDTGRDLNNFLPMIPDPQLIPEPMRQSIGASTAKLTDASLHALVSMPLHDLSEAATAQLRGRAAPVEGGEAKPLTRRRRQSLTSSLLRALSSDKSSEVTETDEEAEKYERLNKESSERLRTSLDGIR